MSKNGNAQAWPMSASNGNGAHTFRGSSLEELLPMIRAELGADAIITKQREGIVGGIGGFFGKRCVEVEARKPAWEPPEPTPALPTRSILDAYDAPETAELAADEDDEPSGETIMDRLLAQAAPFVTEPEERPRFNAFADELAEAVDEQERTATAGRLGDVAEELASCELSGRMVDEILAEAGRLHATFAPDTALVQHARKVVARRLRIRPDTARTGRRVAIVGPAAAGKTLATAKLCVAHSRAGSSVVAVSLAGRSDAIRLATLLDASAVDLTVADAPVSAEVTRETLAGSDLVVADTPAIDTYDLGQIDGIVRLLDAFAPTETHLAVPLGTPVAEMRLLVHALWTRGRSVSIMITHEDSPAAATPVALALVEQLSLSYVTRGTGVDRGLRPADATELARLMLPA
jgi:flagellar biosynthesis protein FlhF